MLRLGLVFVLLAGLATRAHGQSMIITADEALHAPTPARVAAILAAAQRDGWSPQAAGLRGVALRAYQRGNLSAADAWFHVYQWASLFGETEAEFVPKWVAAINAAKVGHANMPTSVPARDTPLSANLSPALQQWLLTTPAFSEAFFSTLAPVDYLPRVFQILDVLYAENPARFQRYANLALAIAVVYDVPPPPFWPHGQVTVQALPRKLPAPTTAFDWWTKRDQQGLTYHALARLPADELKFMVDAAAPFSELEWAQQMVDLPLRELSRAYSMVHYRMDRVKNNQPIWTGPTYRLTDILTNGGICADQAYFATEVGKALGVPTLLFVGAGNDGRHAWFGYLDPAGQWRLDAGRYAEQRYVTGIARDPQTWRELSDHELQFLAERFHTTTAWRQSQIHAEFAVDLLAAGNAPAAVKAARAAVNFEPRNQGAWETLFNATREATPDAKAAEVVLREAALAFQRYADLEAMYVTRVAESLRTRGQTSEAAAEIQRIAHKNQHSRVDISVQQAREVVLNAIRTEPIDQQIRIYTQTVDSLGRSAGIAFYDQVVTLFVAHLLQLHHRAEALHALDHARATLDVRPDSQLETEFNRLQQVIEKSR